MEEIKKQLKDRESYLLQLKKDKIKALKNVPEGWLRVCSHGDRTQYYRRNDSKDLNGVYIRDKNKKIAQQLAQKDYDKKVMAAVERELTAIRKFLSNYPIRNAEQIYKHLHKARQQLITPIKETDEEYVKKWESVDYQRKAFAENIPELYTMKQERVRSKSELIIANLLRDGAVPYRYEYPIYLKGIGKIHPDFTVLNVKRRKELYWEHFGMMDDPEYVEKAMKKIITYEKNQIFPGENLILTYETKKYPINQANIQMLIHHYLHQ